MVKKVQKVHIFGFNWGKPQLFIIN